MTLNIIKKIFIVIYLISLLLVLAFASSCHEPTTKQTIDIKKQQSKKGQLLLPSGKALTVYLADDVASQRKGLSGVKSEDFAANEALWFYYPEEGYRSFWMPDTYFDLDLVFLDAKLKVIRVVPKMPHHEGWQEPPVIARIDPIYCRSVLEIRNDSPLAAEIKTGLTLVWKGQKGESLPFP